MPLFPFVPALFARLARVIATERRLSQFTCGDCPRWQSCGLPPTATCTHRAEEIARGEWRQRRRMLSSLW